jgi:hypothetical protein
MTTTDMTTTAEPLRMNKLRTAVLRGIAAGEVRRVKIGNKYRIEWHKPGGHELGWGRTHGKIFTRWPTQTVEQFVTAGLAQIMKTDLVVCTRRGNAVLRAALTDLVTRQ